VSFELWSTIASVGTFLVIAATAVVAIIQLRHTRSSNQIAAAMTIHSVVESEEFQEGRRFIRDELINCLDDAEFRRTLGVSTNKAARPMIFVGNYYEEIGIFVKYGLVDENIACEMWSNEIVTDWKRMVPAITIIRQNRPSFGWQNFEYMVTVCEAWLKRYPEGKFPRDRRRVRLENVSSAGDD
jgi:Domain of unknown function (DUF4760)